MEGWTKPQKAGLAVALLVAVLSSGASMTGYVNPALGWSLFIIGLAGIFVTLVWAWWPHPITRFRDIVLSRFRGKRWTSDGFTWSSEHAGEHHGSTSIAVRIRPKVDIQPIDFLVEYDAVGDEPQYWATAGYQGQTHASWFPDEGEGRIWIRGNSLRLVAPEPVLRPGEELNIYVISPGQTKPKSVRRKG